MLLVVKRHISQWSTFPSGPLAPLIWPENLKKGPIT